jgi:hypothetical protein
MAIHYRAPVSDNGEWARRNYLYPRFDHSCCSFHLIIVSVEILTHTYGESTANRQPAFPGDHFKRPSPAVI